MREALASGSSPPPPPPVSLNPGINDLMTSSSSKHDFHLQTPLSTTTTTTTTTPPFNTEESFCTKEFKKCANDGWMGGTPNLSLSLSLSLARELQSHIYIYLFILLFFCRIFLFSKQSAKNRKKQGCVTLWPCH
jgi:hypothetical protein